jgi:hypothetical protein
MTLQDVGFIHCSYAHQVAGVANAFYADLQDLVLMVIDPTRLAAPLRPEAALHGAASTALSHFRTFTVRSTWMRWLKSVPIRRRQMGRSVRRVADRARDR